MGFPQQLVLSELFDFFPRNLELVGACSEYPVYSNESIQKATLQWLSKSKSTKNIVSVVEEGMAAKKILVGFTNPSIWSFLKTRLKVGLSKTSGSDWFNWGIFGISGESATLGLYSKIDGTVAVFLDPKVNILGKALTSVPSIIAHELCHKVAGDMTKEFLKHQLDGVLVPYYSEVLKNIDPKFMELDEEKLRLAITNVTLAAEGEKSSGLIRDVIKHWWIFFTKCGLSEDETEIAIYKFLIPFYTYILDERLGGCPAKLQSRSKEFLEYLYKGYDKIGATDAREYTLAGQEAAFTSEVVAIANEWEIDSATVNMIRKLKFK